MANVKLIVRLRSTEKKGLRPTLGESMTSH